VNLITEDDDVFRITLDGKGRELAGMDGTEVKVEGTVEEKDDDIWLTVRKFETVKQEAEPEE